MLGLNLIPTLVRTALAMLLVGGLIGYVGTAFTTTLVVIQGSSRWRRVERRAQVHDRFAPA